jgi:hypothetical protein
MGSGLNGSADGTRHCINPYTEMGKKKTGRGFSLEDLRNRGFVEGPDGTWGKGDTCVPSEYSRPPSKVLESNPGNAAKRKDRSKSGGEGDDYEGDRFQLIIVSHRTRFIDASNACVKYVEDCIVKKGLMPDDGPKFCPAPRFIQVKCRTGEERTDVYLFRLFTEASPSESSPYPPPA